MSRPLQFGFDGHSDNLHLPNNYISNTVVYTGTHDNPPTREWYEELHASQELVVQLRAAGHEVIDFGAHSLGPDDDYPDYVTPLARAVAAGQVERGVAICGSGAGASVCANKIPGVRTALIHDHFSARQGVEDDHMNIICMGGRTVGPAVAWDLLQTILEAKFSQAERHLRRLGKLASLEETRGVARTGHFRGPLRCG